MDNHAMKNMSQLGRAAAEAREQPASVGADAFQDNAKGMRQAWRTSIDIATNLTQRSADPFAVAFGLSGEQARHTMQQPARDVEAIVRTSEGLAQAMDAISRQWFDFMRDRVDNNLIRVSELSRCRTPLDLAALQLDLMHDNLEGALECSWRVADLSLKAADNVTKKITRNVERMRRATWQ